MRFRVACATGLAGAVLLCSPRAARAEGIALDQFQPAPAGDVFFGVPSPFARGNLTPRGLVYFDYADQPLKLTKDDQGRGTVVNRQGMLHLAASLAIQDRLLISASLPVALVQTGDSPKVGTATLTAPSKAEIGDLRVGARVRMVGEDGDAFQLGVSLDVHTPTAKSGFVGEGKVRAAPQIIIGGQFRGGVTWAWTVAVGAMIRASANPSALTYGGGIAAQLFGGRIQIGPEVYAATPLQTGSFNLSETVKIPAQLSTNVELLVGARVRIFKDLVAGWAAGPGLTRAVGTPELRFAGMLGWAPGIPKASAPANADTDADGILDAVDACPYAAGPKSADPKKHGCPVVDDDEDGIPNDEDACPSVYGHPSRDRKKNGCPEPVGKGR